MFNKMKLTILNKLLEKSGRKMSLEKLGGKYIIRENDHVGCRDYLLKGTYTYDQVMELNKKTGYNASFGHCKELGSIAFIGIPNPNYAHANGYFNPEIQEYGKSIDDEEYYFETYSDEMAKYIKTYTVYGMGDPRDLEGHVEFDKIRYFYDYRYKRKQAIEDGYNPDVLEMDIKLFGTYTFKDARKIAYSSTGEFHGASGEDRPIQFAIVGVDTPVGIIGLWEPIENVSFKDVWDIHENEPKNLPIRFLTPEEAKGYTNYSLYYLSPNHSYGRKKLVIEKVDKSLSQNYDFIDNDGNDYRLKELPKEKVKTLDEKKEIQ